MDYTYDEVIQALKKAHAAGDVQGARRLAEFASTLKEKPPTPVKEPEAPKSWMEKLFGETGKTVSGLLQQQEETVKGGITSPELSKGIMKGAFYDPLVGSLQLGANLVGQGEAAQKGVEAYKQAIGDTSGVGEFVGAMISPVNRVLGPLSGVSKGATVARAAGAGALQAGLQPTTADNYWSDKAFNVGVGAVIGGAFPLASITVKKVRDILGNVNLTKKAREEELRKYLSEAAGPEKEQVIKDLRSIGESVPGSAPTAAEAVANRPSAVGLASVQEEVLNKPGAASLFMQREAEREAARIKQLGQIASPDGMTPSQMEAMRNQVTAPLREKALKQANQYGEEYAKLSSQFEQQRQQLVGALVGAGDKAAAQRNLANLQRQSIEKTGVFPLDTVPIKERLIKSLQKPGERVKDDVKAAYTSLLDKLNEYTGQGGVIDSNDLYAIRQEIGDSIKASMKARNIEPTAKRVAGIEKAMQGLIDDSITKASGSNLWKEYLTKYADYSNRADRMKIGLALQRKLAGEGTLKTEAAGAFAKAVANSRPLVIEATGKAYPGTIQQALNKQEMGVVNSVLTDLENVSRAKAVGKKVATEPMGSEGLGVNILSRPVTIMKDLMHYIKKGNQKMIDTKTAELMLDPQSLATFLETIPVSKFDKLMPLWIKNMSPDFAQSFISRFGIASGTTLVGE